MARNRILQASTLLALISVGCAPAERSDTGEIESAGSVDAFTMRVGDCFDDSSTSSGEISDVPGVPCGDPHDNEVFAIFDLPGGDWLGADSVGELADEGCGERFDPAIGATYEESVLMITTLTPTETSWNRRKDREVICIAYHMDLEKLTGSVLNSGM